MKFDVWAHVARPVPGPLQHHIILKGDELQSDPGGTCCVGLRSHGRNVQNNKAQSRWDTYNSLYPPPSEVENCAAAWDGFQLRRTK